MIDLRPGVLSVRALNEYRRRDVLTYLSLRYYLHNTAAQSDIWAKSVATDQLLTRTSHPYLHVKHFKERTATGSVALRDIFLPGANEAMAETALLDECAKHPSEFGGSPCVFSYRLNSGRDRTGVFENYIFGIRRRHESIASECEANSNGVVRYTDIKRFYPSISIDLARQAWIRQSNLASLPKIFQDLGVKLISDYESTIPKVDSGILTGPIFSHLLGNLVLRELDEDCSNNLPAKYFRYVDDFVLVGSSSAVNQSEAMLRKRLDSLGLTLHDESHPKHIEVSTGEWLEGRMDFTEPRGLTSWRNFIGDLKRFIISHPEQRTELQDALRSENFRIPISDYSRLANEKSYLKVLRRLSSKSWFRQKHQLVTVHTLIAQASWLRKQYEQEFQSFADGAESLEGFKRKRLIPRLRYRAGRLIYLATEDKLQLLSQIGDELPELHLHSSIMKAVAGGSIDHLLPLGTNAAQAAAQSLRAAGKSSFTTLEHFSEAAEQSLAMFYINGVTVNKKVEVSSTATPESDLLRFAISGTDTNLMKNAEPFLRELACLHGITDQARHPEILDLVYDKDEVMAMDAIDQLNQSLSW
jgi:hypothetical protein